MGRFDWQEECCSIEASSTPYSTPLNEIPAAIRVFLNDFFFKILADEKADCAVPRKAKLFTRLRNRRFNRIEWSKMH
jgi:hypothetical protein